MYDCNLQFIILPVKFNFASFYRSIGPTPRLVFIADAKAFAHYIGAFDFYTIIPIFACLNRLSLYWDTTICASSLCQQIVATVSGEINKPLCASRIGHIVLTAMFV